MAENLKKRVRSQRGASLSFALFVLLVCTMVSAAVLAASSTASGHYIELGKFDQRYYAVVSAADLFRGTVTSDGKATYKVVETRSGADGYNERTSDGLPDTTSILLESITRTPDVDFDFLQDVTLYALYGPGGVPVTNVVGTSWDDLKPFDADNDDPVSNWWKLASGSNGYSENTYTIKPQMNDDIDVRVTVRVYNNWLVEVVAANDTTSTAKKYSLYMAFQGTCEQGEPLVSSTLGDTVVSGGNVTNNVDVIETRTTTVTWKLVRIMPGRGFAND